MRLRMIVTLLALTLVIAACTADQPSTLVAEDGSAPYYTTLADAQAAARADQYIVVDFYTDW